MGELVIALILAIGGYLGYRWVTRGDKAPSAEQPASGAQHGGVTRKALPMRGRGGEPIALIVSLFPLTRSKAII
jgi:hypothetical protein